MKQATLIKTDGTKVELTEKDLCLPKMQKYVGGMIQIVSIELDGKEKDVVCNEEGKLMDLPFNPAATKLYHKAGITDDVLVGDVIFADAGMIK